MIKYVMPVPFFWIETSVLYILRRTARTHWIGRVWMPIGVVTDESVSLMEGDNVTLHTNTEIQQDDVIEWRFKDKKGLKKLARINSKANNLLTINADVLDGIFRDRLRMNNQTGDLTITNVTKQHTGVYQLDISSDTIVEKRFNVSVSGDKVKNVTVGDSAIQHNNITKKPGDEKIVWRIRHNNSPVAEIIRNGKETNDKVHDERFRDRLQVDDQTGDLIITNITTEDSGSYEVDITVGSNSYTIHRSFSVNVKDPQKDQHGSNKDEDQSSSKSSGVIAGVCVVLLVLAVLAVAVAVFLYRRPSKDARKRVSTEDPDGGL